MREYELKNIEIRSIEQFITEITLLRNNTSKTNDILKRWFFRGQKDIDFKVLPNIFRKNLLASEYEMIKSALRINPSEFRDCLLSFDILTKLQHYGLGTRLLDVTLNPLVALYFATEPHKKFIENSNNLGQLFECDGCVFSSYAYSCIPDEISVIILSELPFIDIKNEYTIEMLINALHRKLDLSDKDMEYFTIPRYHKLIEIIQNTKFILANQNNKRLVMQSGAFVLTGAINININTNKISNSILSKAYMNLDSAFNGPRFIVPAKYKESIREELDFFNINESTLFPELEHQLNYIQSNTYFVISPIKQFQLYKDELSLDNNDVSEPVIKDDFPIHGVLDMDEKNNLLPEFIKPYIALMTKKLGYSYLKTSDSEESVLQEELLIDSLNYINPQTDLPDIMRAISNLKHLAEKEFILGNKIFTNWARNGIIKDSENESTINNFRVCLFDNKNIENNRYAISHFVLNHRGNELGHIHLYVNGIPVIEIIVSNQDDTDRNLSIAYDYLQNSKKENPRLFTYNTYCMICTGTQVKIGFPEMEISSFKKWEANDLVGNTSFDFTIELLFEEIINKKDLINFIQNFIYYDNSNQKQIAASHQYRAVQKAVEATRLAFESTGKIGLIQHIPGSGKSITMLLYVNQLINKFKNTKVLVLIDRKEREEQLLSLFINTQDFLNCIPIEIKNIEQLKHIGHMNEPGIYLSTIQKFVSELGVISESKNIVVIVENTNSFKRQLGANVKASLPNASYLGFTDIKNYEHEYLEFIFGEYIDIYSFSQGIDEKILCPIVYEHRLENLDMDDELLFQQGYDDSDKYKFMELFYNTPLFLDKLSIDIIEHYESRQHVLKGKAIIAVSSRAMAIKLYEKILEIRPEWEDKVKPIITANPNDPYEWLPLTGNKVDRNKLIECFMDDGSALKIAIVVDFLLTTINMPSLSTMYICKPMRGYSLLQVISRLTRPCKGKENGLVVDYIGLPIQKIISHLT